MRGKKAKRLRRLARKIGHERFGYYMVGTTRKLNVGCVRWFSQALKGAV